jgi:hypothetical protein
MILSSNISRGMSLCLLLAVATPLSMAFAAPVELEDFAARLQFAYYSEDVRALQATVVELERWKAPARIVALQQSQLAYGYWKLAQLEGARKAAADEARHCATHADRSIAEAGGQPGPVESALGHSGSRGVMAEAYALKAACIDLAPGLTERLRLPLGGTKGGPELQRAMALEPTNPRVQLVSAISGLDPRLRDLPAAKSGIEVDVGDYEKLAAAVAAFEAEDSAASTGVSGEGVGTLAWGHAEALAWQGRVLLLRGDALAARNALERAMVIAPDYLWARRLLGSLPPLSPSIEEH